MRPRGDPSAALFDYAFAFKQLNAAYPLARLLHCMQRRPHIMSLQFPEENNYPVEVSGWDSAENFFVEKTMLHWDEAEGKTVLLRSRLHEGTVVFLRLSQPTTTANNFPIAYQVRRIDAPDNRGLARVFLVQLRPRREAEEALDEAFIENPPSRC
jgi:hypothetical protein